MRRREFITIVGGAAAWPLAAARAQQRDRLRRIGLLMTIAEKEPEAQARLAAFRAGLRERGWVEGRNIEIEYRFAVGDDVEKARALAKELVELHPDVLVAAGTPSLVSEQEATREIPIVFVGIADPVAQGFVQSLAKPGGNITGLGLEEPSVGAKWVQLLTEIAPRTKSISVLFNPSSAPYARMFLPAMETSRGSVEVIVSPVATDVEIEETIVAAGQRAPAGLILLPDSFLFIHRDLIVALAAQHRVPAVYALPSYSASGGLLSYGIDRTGVYRGAAPYVDRILKGEKPADLPVQMPTEYRLVINLKTAKALGLDVSLQLQQRADDVID
jgi:putative tryptophan/tyrosine transport system substrate-binding protein